MSENGIFVVDGTDKLDLERMCAQSKSDEFMPIKRWLCCLINGMENHINELHRWSDLQADPTGVTSIMKPQYVHSAVAIQMALRCPNIKTGTWAESFKKDEAKKTLYLRVSADVLRADVHGAYVLDNFETLFRPGNEPTVVDDHSTSPSKLECILI